MLRPTLIAALLLAGAAQGYEEVAVTDGGHIEGRVTYSGTVPLRKIIRTKDQQVCGGPRDEAALQVGTDGGVQDAVVYLKAMARGKPWGAPAPTPQLDNRACRFEPSMQIIRAGTIDILNSDPVLHNTHGFYGRRTAFNVALPEQGMRVTRELPRPGLVRVECDAHGWMLAHVFVADSPYHVLTGADGRFRLGDVPPGDYTLVVSHPYTGDHVMAVTVQRDQAARLAIELKKK